jgi:hypothetical protein
MAESDKRAGGAAKDSGANRRKFERRDTSIPAKLEHEGQVYAGHVDNLSLDGCLFNPAPALAAGARVKLSLADDPKTLPASVVMTSARGLHCRLHAAAARLVTVSTQVDDMALLLLTASRPASLLPAEPAPAPKKKTAKKKAAKKAVKKAAKKAPKKIAKKAAKKSVKKKAAKKSVKKAAKKKPAARRRR